MPGGFGDDPEVGGRYENYGAVNPNDPSVANGQISPQQWAEYQARRRRDAILGTLGILGGTVGLGFAGQALSGAGTAANAANATTSAATLPAAATEGMLPMSVAGPASGGAGLLGGMSARDIAGIAASLGGTIGGAMQGRNQSMAPNSMATDPQMKELLDMMMGRVRKSEPLYDSVLAMANGLLPTQYQKGGGGMG